VTDVRVDVATFFVPHRHVYGQDWIDYISEGYDETVNLTTIDAGNGNSWDEFQAVPWIKSGEIPLWLVQGYLNIWNRYYRPPKQSIAERTTAYSISGNDAEGFLCSTLPAIWNTGHESGAYPTNNSVSSATSFTVTDLAKKMAEWDTELQREWKDTYYRDFMRNIWGGNASVDADQRPTLLAHSTKWMSGFDVYGTASSSFGEAIGRMEMLVDHGFPRRLFPEHGVIWTMLLVRTPPTHEEEIHWLVGNPNPSYAEMACDPTLVSKEEPYDLELKDVFRSTSTTSLGKIPFAQWYRMQPNIVHKRYDSTNGFAFFDTIPADLQEAVLYPSRRFTSAFRGGGDFLHWQSSLKNSARCLRVVPDSGSSVFAGTRT
jgi:hypothetical protein